MEDINREREQKENRLRQVIDIISNPENYKIKNRTPNIEDIQKLEQEEKELMQWFKEHPLTSTLKPIHLTVKKVYESKDSDYSIRKYGNNWYLFSGAEAVKATPKINEKTGLPESFTILVCDSSTERRIVQYIRPIVFDEEEETTIEKPKKIVLPKCDKVTEGLALQDTRTQDEMLITGLMFDSRMNTYRKPNPDELNAFLQKQKEAQARLAQKRAKSTTEPQTPKEPVKRLSFLEKLKLAKEKKKNSES